MKQATMIYQYPGKKLKVGKDLFDYKIVDAATDSLEKALKDGWSTSPAEAKDNQEPTRQELETKADELRVKYKKNTPDSKLRERIEDALFEAELGKSNELD